MKLTTTRPTRARPSRPASAADVTRVSSTRVHTATTPATNAPSMPSAGQREPRNERTARNIEVSVVVRAWFTETLAVRPGAAYALGRGSRRAGGDLFEGLDEDAGIGAPTVVLDRCRAAGGCQTTLLRRIGRERPDRLGRSIDVTERH